MHIKRFMDRLKESGIAYALYDQGGQSMPEANVFPSSRTKLGYLSFLVRVRESVVHIHATNLATIVLAEVILTVRGKTLVITLHGQGVAASYKKKWLVVRKILGHRLRRVHHVICVNQAIKDWLGGVGLPESRITVSPAFIPPSKQEIDDTQLPPRLSDFLAAHTPVIGTQGWFGSFFHGVDIYSFDMIAELVEHLARTHSRVGVYTVISGTFEETHRKHVLRERQRLGLEDKWLIIEDKINAIPLYLRSDVFVRPTVTDGDSVSIRECLFLNVPVVASDAAWRPEGCIVFKNRDSGALVEAVLSTLRDIESVRARVGVLEHADPSDRVIEVYQELLRDP